jgi:heme/copper-type cytochrome/quinol oxidase subunit 3
VAAGSGALWSARRSIGRDDVKGLITWLAVGLVATGIGLAVFIRDLARLPFTPQDHSYGSIVYTFGGYAVLIVTIGLIMGLATAVYAVRGHYNAHRLSPVDNVARYGTATGVMWALALGTLYLVPHLT